MSYTTSSSITRLDLDKASFSFSINNLPEAKSITKTGEKIKSMDFSIGASEFSIGIYPNGDEDMNDDDEFTSVFLYNDSDHDVTVDFTISIGSLVSKTWEKSSVIKSTEGSGWDELIKKTALGQNIMVKAEVTLVHTTGVVAASGPQINS